MSRPRLGGAKEQVARLLTLVPYLHTRGQVGLDEAATALGVPADQLVKDLKVLLMCGLPGGYPDDLIDVDLDALEGPGAEGVIRVSNADYLARPLRLTATEASALVVALRAMRTGAGPETAEVVDRALAKLEAAAAEGAGAARRIDPGDTAGEAELDRLRVRLSDAAAHGRQVRLRYWVPTRDEESERVVDPRGVVTVHGLGYLDAWCHTAEAPRLFRLDRIHRAEVLDRPVATRAEPRRDLAEALFRPARDAARVTLRLAPAARWVPEYYPVEAVRRRSGGELEVDLAVADERWLRRLLLRLAPHARVVAPSDLAAVFESDAQAVLRWYQPTGVG